MGWMGDPIGDYLKLRGATWYGIILYPIIAPLILIVVGIFMIKNCLDDSK